jgi:rfaE bifunctional protein kinase chain/domain
LDQVSAKSERPLCHYIDAFPRYRVAILGDLMIDRYIWGRASRISQEAPVPVVAVQRENAVPGGAANVARNVVSLGAQAEVFGVIGNDYEGQELRRLLNECQVDTSQLLVVPGRRSTVKTRVLAANQQVVRIDSEDTDPLPRAVYRELLFNLERRLQQGELDALILEDYAKGVFTRSFIKEAIALANRYQVLVTLDPHPTHAFNAHGLALMTPNRAEAFALAGLAYKPGVKNPLDDRALRRVGARLQSRWQASQLLLTLGAEGMLLFAGADAEPVHIPTRAQQVFDVSGAGDTVMATMVLALLANAPAAAAAKIANYAAGVVVGIVGTAAIDAAVLRQRLQAGE